MIHRGPRHLRLGSTDPRAARRRERGNGCWAAAQQAGGGLVGRHPIWHGGIDGVEVETARTGPFDDETAVRRHIAHPPEPFLESRGCLSLEKRHQRSRRIDRTDSGADKQYAFGRERRVQLGHEHPTATNADVNAIGVRQVNGLRDIKRACDVGGSPPKTGHCARTPSRSEVASI